MVNQKIIKPSARYIRLFFFVLGVFSFWSMPSENAVAKSLLQYVDSIHNDSADFNIHLFIEEREMNELGSNLPHSGFKYKPGRLLYPNGDTIAVKIRYRGDGKFHWLYDRKSYRIKTQKNNLYQGHRRFNLIVTKGHALIYNHLTYKLAKQMGLLAPDSKVIVLYINGQYDGIRIYTEQLREVFLRNNNIMPGDFYSGENIGQSKFQGLTDDNIFHGAYYWQKIASNNHYDKKNKTNLKIFLDGLDSNNFDMLDLLSFARFSVLLTLTQSTHVDNIHNWRLYYDNYTEKFYPVVWDVVGWYKGFIPAEGLMPDIEIITTTLYEKLFKDYRFLYLRQLVLLDFFKRKERAFIEIMDAEIEKLIPRLRTNDHFLDMQQREMNCQETIKQIHKFGNDIKGLLSNIKQVTLFKYNRFLDGSLTDKSLSSKGISAQFHNALEFHGTNKSVVFNTEGIPNATFTYEFWFKTDQSHEIDKENASRGVSGTSNQHFAVLPSYGGKENFRGTGVSVGINGISLYEHKSGYLGARIVYEASLKGWSHIAVVYENSAPSLYVNGNKVASRNATNDIIKPIFSLSGHFHDNKYFNGVMDEFRVWSRALTQSEIEANMNRELTGDEKGLALYYNFNKLKKDKIFSDVSTNSRDGILVNGPPSEPTPTYKYSNTDYGLRILLNGRIPIQKIFLGLKKKTPPPNKIFIEYVLNEKVIRKDVSNSISMSSDQMILNQPLLANMEVVHGEMKIFPATYDLIIEGLKMNLIKNVKFQLLDLDESIIEAEFVKDIEMENFKNVINIIQENPVKEPLVWQGEVKIEGMEIIDNDLLIKPGTKVYLGEKAVVKVLGKLKALGTKADSIHFLPLNNDRPWGALVLMGEKANGSQLKHCSFSKGSGLKGEIFEYIGMLSIHNVKDVAINNCRFTDNRAADDMVHVVYSKVIFDSCRFEGAFADAVDADISSIVVKNCEFINAGDDGLDLMTSKSVIWNSQFINCKDKGIAAGEASDLLVINSRFSGNTIGVQCKEDSKTIIYNSLLKGNGKALDAYKKNWRYSSGGVIELYKSVITGNSQNMTAQAKSSVYVFDCFIDSSSSAGNDDSAVNSNTGKITFTACDTSSEITPSSNNMIELNLQDDFFLEYLKYKKDDLRGTF